MIWRKCNWWNWPSWMGLIAIPKRSRLLVSLRPCPGQANITQTVSTNVWMLTCLRLLFYSQMGRMTLRNASWWNWPLSTERTATRPNQPPPRLVAVSRPPLVSPAPLGQRPLAIHASSVCAVLIALRFFFLPLFIPWLSVFNFALWCFFSLA